MTLVAWEPTFSVDNDLMDAQHQKLFDLLNQLYDTQQQGKTQEGISRGLVGLSRYSMEHFQAEELLMEKNNYRELQVQRREHAVFIEKVVELQHQYLNGNLREVEPMLVFLKNWLVSHILVTDQKYKNYLH
jgi:hemerythrin-like metal-binding protein